MTRQNFFVFFLFTCIGFFAYRNCFTVFIPTDNYSLLYYFSKSFSSTFNEWIHNGAPYFVTLPLLYVLYHLFGDSPACWVITTTFLHILTSFVVYLMAKQLIKLFFQKNFTVIAFFSALVFLISPYQTEIVLWAPICIRTFHALITFLGFYFFSLYLVNRSVRMLMVIHFLFLTGIFSYEVTLICPLIYLAFFLLFKLTGHTLLSAKKFIYQILFVQIFFIAIYFYVCTMLTGHWLWHAGPLESFAQTTDYSKTFLKYMVKFFIFYRYLPLSDFDSFLRSFFDGLYVNLFLLLTLIALLIFSVSKIIKFNREVGYFLLTMFVCFSISLLPFLPLDSSFLKYIFPDRYGYMASAFFYIFLISILFFMTTKLALPILIGYCALCWILLMQTISVWNSTNDYCNTLVINYKPFLKYDNVFLLNVPSYYEGVVAFRSAFPETIYMRYNNYPERKINVISGAYQESWSDTLRSVKISGDSIEVVGPEKHTPHFCTGGWAKSYHTNEYKVVFDSTGCSYMLAFKHGIPPNSAILYTSNGKWKKAE